MWGKQSVCVSCGVFKRRFAARCSRCGYVPSSDYELARALILSRRLNTDKSTVGRSSTELKCIAADIRRGRPFLFDPREEQRALSAYHRLQTLTRGRRWFARAVAIAAAALLLGFLYLILQPGKS